MKNNVKRLLIINIPYVILALFATKLPQMWRLTTGATVSEKLLNVGEGFSLAFADYLPSFYPQDFLIGMILGVLLRLGVYLKGKNAKKYRHGREHGSARWGNRKDIDPQGNPKGTVGAFDGIILQAELRQPWHDCRLCHPRQRPQQPPLPYSLDHAIYGAGRHMGGEVSQGVHHRHRWSTDTTSKWHLEVKKGRHNRLE